MGLSWFVRIFFGLEDVHKVATGFTDRSDDGFEVRGFSLFVNFEEDVAVTRWRIAEQRGQGGSELVWGDLLAVEVSLESGVNGHTGEGGSDHFYILELGGLPLDVAIILSPRKDDKKDKQQKADITHRKGGDRSC